VHVHVHGFDVATIWYALLWHRIIADYHALLPLQSGNVKRCNNLMLNVTCYCDSGFILIKSFCYCYTGGCHCYNWMLKGHTYLQNYFKFGLVGRFKNKSDKNVNMQIHNKNLVMCNIMLYISPYAPGRLCLLTIIITITFTNLVSIQNW